MKVEKLPSKTVLLGIIILLVGGVVGLAWQNLSLSENLKEARLQIESLENQLKEANIKIYNLEKELKTVKEELTQAKNELYFAQQRISELERAELDGLASLSNFTDYFLFEGMVTNYGVETVYSVYAKVYLYKNGVIVYEDKVFVGDIAGREIDDFELRFTYEGEWDDWAWTLDWS